MPRGLKSQHDLGDIVLMPRMMINGDTVPGSLRPFPRNHVEKPDGVIALPGICRAAVFRGGIRKNAHGVCPEFRRYRDAYFRRKGRVRAEKGIRPAQVEIRRVIPRVVLVFLIDSHFFPVTEKR